MKSISHFQTGIFWIIQTCIIFLNTAFVIYWKTKEKSKFFSCLEQLKKWQIYIHKVQTETQTLTLMRSHKCFQPWPLDGGIEFWRNPLHHYSKESAGVSEAKPTSQHTSMLMYSELSEVSALSAFLWLMAVGYSGCCSPPAGHCSMTNSWPGWSWDLT